MAATIVANLFGDRNLWSAVLFALCNAGEAVLAAWFIERYFGPDFRLGKLRNVLGLFAAAIVGTAVSAIGGTVGIKLFHNATPPLLTTWQHWFASDGLGIVTVAPLLIELASLLARPAVAQRARRRRAGGRGAGAGVRACHLPAVGAVGDHRTGRAAVRAAVVARGAMPAGLRLGGRVHRQPVDRVDDDLRHRLFRQSSAFDGRPRFRRSGQHSACDAQRIGSRCAVCRNPRQAKTGRNSAAGQRNATLPH